MAAKVLRTVVAGGMIGRIISAAHAYLVERSRVDALEHIGSDHHRPADDPRNLVGFFDVYGFDGIIGEETIGRVGWRPAVIPEMVLDAWVIERAELIYDSNPRENPGDREVIGWVLFRYYDNSDPVTLRLKVHLIGYVNAHYGHTCFSQRIVEPVSKGSPEDLRLDDLAKQHAQTVSEGV